MIIVILNLFYFTHQAKERWNFDFKNERPLPGKWEWVKEGNDGKEIADSLPETPDHEKVEADPTIENCTDEKSIKKIENVEEVCESN